MLLVVQTTAEFALAWFAGYRADEGFVESSAVFWLNTFLYLPTVFHAAYFWFAATAIYLLLRRDIDEKQADEIYLDDELSPGAAASAEA